MKKFISFMIAAIAAVGSYAQTSQVATLSHEGNISTFYYSSALKEAFDAAVDGDIITLSAGAFQSVDFKDKKITVRGAGMMPDSNPTTITGGITIDIVDTDDNRDIPFSLEGLLFVSSVNLKNAYNATVQKCHFTQVDSHPGDGFKNSRFLHCFFESLHLSHWNNCSVSYINCCIKNAWWTSGSHTLTNCTFIFASTGLPLCGSFTNCLFVTETNDYLSASHVAAGCVYVGPGGNFFNGNLSATNRSFPADTPVFKEDSQTYELLDELTTTWLGNDGTQVGIHGGALPFSPYGTNPRITKFEVSPKTTPDGKLSVDIEVKAN